VPGHRAHGGVVVGAERRDLHGRARPVGPHRAGLASVTRMPSGATSCASTPEKPSTANLAD
jgi:hypothetical protein